MSCHHNWFFHYTPLSSLIPVVLGDDSSIIASGVGHIHVKMCANGTKHHSVLQDVLYVPGLQSNLLSVAQLVCYGAKVHFADRHCQLNNACGVLTCTVTIMALRTPFFSLFTDATRNLPRAVPPTQPRQPYLDS